MLLNCGVGEDSWESLGLQGDQSWVFTGRTDVEAETPNTVATWCEELTHLKRPWCWERSRAGGEGDDRGWDSSMASPTQWTWVWVDSRSWWWTGRPGMLRFMGSQRARHDWATELNWNKLSNMITQIYKYTDISLGSTYRTHKTLSYNIQTAIPDSSLSVISNLERESGKYWQS